MTLLRKVFFSLMHDNEFKLGDAVSPWDGSYYIGFVLDAVSQYLGWRGQVEYLPAEPGPLSELTKATIVRKDDDRIIGRVYVERIHRSGTYRIKGFPSDMDFELFRRSIQDVYNLSMTELEKLESSKKELPNRKITAGTLESRLRHREVPTETVPRTPRTPVEV